MSLVKDTLVTLVPEIASALPSLDAMALPAASEGAKTREELKALLTKVKAAQAAYATFSQEKVDAIFRASALAANAARIPLARMAVAETRMGIVEDKVIKNHFASEFIYNKYRDAKTDASVVLEGALR